MKVLVLGGSRQFARPGVTEEQSVAAQTDLEHRALALPIESVRKMIWPTEKLPGLVEEWVRETAPDMVVVAINEAWYNYEGVPLKKVRKRGPIGRLTNHLWRVVAENPRVMNSKLAHRGRRKLAEATGAEPEFTPEQVVDRMSAVFRTILRSDESASVIVVGPFNLPEFDVAYSKKAASKRLVRREKVNTGISKLCRELHLDHVDMYHEVLQQRQTPTLLADGLHTDVAGSRQEAAFWASVLMPFYKRELLKRGESKQHAAV